ncbi:zinc-finger domain-containing protein [Acidimangrovimonas sediminis]|uniref:zinc-finger domain-containing protein n=1 Tax=Acidimangrovimonas sediminis TaxID=2056283 RepID=UPI000C7FA808|nr:zinc-finger domain-containing protein [Acidimangrovimonas sediminis]
MTTQVPETEYVSAWKVACDGGNGALGHPRVWLTIPHERGWVECGYCDKRYIHESFRDSVDESYKDRLADSAEAEE